MTEVFLAVFGYLVSLHELTVAVALAANTYIHNLMHTNDNVRNTVKVYIVHHCGINFPHHSRLSFNMEEFCTADT